MTMSLLDTTCTACSHLDATSALVHCAICEATLHPECGISQPPVYEPKAGKKVDPDAQCDATTWVCTTCHADGGWTPCSVKGYTHWINTKAPSSMWVSCAGIDYDDEDSDYLACNTQGCSHTFTPLPEGGKTFWYCEHHSTKYENCHVPTCGVILEIDNEETMWCDNHQKWCCYDHYDGDNESCTHLEEPSLKEPPWTTRGIEIPTTTFPDPIAFEINQGNENVAASQWDIPHTTVSPDEAAGTFYLLEAIIAGAHRIDDSPDSDAIIYQAQAMLDELVAKWDPIFRNYLDMVVGGELRHHPGIAQLRRNGGRAGAWMAWRAIRQILGADALVDAATIFRDFTMRGFGGPLWANCAEVMHARVTNRITPKVFVDRVFNLEHNGGCVLNKLKWSPATNLTRIQYAIGNLHGLRDGEAGLIYYSTDAARRLWYDWIRAQVRAAPRHRLSWSERAQLRKYALPPFTDLCGQHVLNGLIGYGSNFMSGLEFDDLWVLALGTWHTRYRWDGLAQAPSSIPDRFAHREIRDLVTSRVLRQTKWPNRATGQPNGQLLYVAKHRFRYDPDTFEYELLDPPAAQHPNAGMHPSTPKSKLSPFHHQQSMAPLVTQSVEMSFTGSDDEGEKF